MSVENVSIDIDEHSGFCFGVTTAIEKAERELETSTRLYCLGDIVHNSDEVKRLENKGLSTITHRELDDLRDAKVLLRAHGEPPTTYDAARRNNIEIVDATCPVVLKLQQRIKHTYMTRGSECQIVIYGKKGHAEVNGLVGQTDGAAIVIENVDEIGKIDFSRPVVLYSQTTKSPEGLREMIAEISGRMQAGVDFEYHDTICRQVSTRVEHLRRFAESHDVVLFVTSAQSSNGRVLFEKCRQTNPRSFMVTNESEIDPSWLSGAATIGVCGATSTPRWLMERVRDKAKSLI